MPKQTLMALALLTLGLVGGLGAEEKSLQAQLDDLKSQVDYIKNNYEPSEPVEQIKQVTEWVSPSGELFTEPQKGDVSPTDGSPLTARTTYRKMKFSRRELVSDKIAAAIAGSVDGHVQVGLSMVGVLQGLVGQGDSVDALGQTRSANRTAATGQFDLTFAGKPMRDSLMFVDLNSGVGPGLDGLAAAAGNSATFNPAYLNGGGNPSVREAWVSFHTPRKNFGLQAGVIDLTNVFDANLVANDETSQFLTGSFVNSPILGQPANNPGAILRADFSRWNFKLGVQDTQPSTVGMTDDVYGIAELGFLYNFFGDANGRLWARQQPRGSNQPDQAFGLSFDHRMTTNLTTFWRYSKQGYVEAFDGVNRTALNKHDWSASGGFELGNMWARHLKDRFGVGYGRNDEQNGDYEDYSEVYYKTVLTPGFSLSLHGQGDFDRVRGAAGAAALPNIFALGLRTQLAY